MIEHPPMPARLTVAALVHWQGRFLPVSYTHLTLPTILLV